MPIHASLITSHRNRHESVGLAAGLLLFLCALSGCGGESTPSLMASGNQSGVGVGTGGAGGGNGGSGNGGSGNASSGNGGGGGNGGSGGNGGAQLPPPTSGIEFVDIPYAIDIAPDGSTALLQDMDGGAYFYDTIAHELHLKTSIGDPANANALAISGTGRMAAAHGLPIVAGLWSDGQGWVDLPNTFPSGCDAFEGGAWDISADGKIAVGMNWNGCHVEAFRWTDTGSDGDLTILQTLGTSFSGPTTPPDNRASVVSDDGKVIAGFAENNLASRSPAVWHEDGTGFLLDPTFQDSSGEVLSISADGKVLAGVLVNDAFSWTEEGGIVMLGKPPGAVPADSTFPNAISADGQLIFGVSGLPWQTTPTAFVWTEAAGNRALSDVVAQAGIDVPNGYALIGVYGASADGSVVLGGAYDDAAKLKTFILRLPVSAYGVASL